MKNKICGIFLCIMLGAMSMVTALESDSNFDEQVIMNDNVLIEENSGMKSLGLASKDTSVLKDSETDFAGKNIVKDLLKEKIDLINYDDGFNFKKSKYNPTNERFYLKSTNICFLSGNYNIQGFVEDKFTSSPIENAQVIIQWNGDRQSYVREVTFSDLDGYYNVDFELDEFLRNACIIIRYNQYYSIVRSIQEYLMNDNDIWFNVSLESGGPLENNVISGYVKDLETGDPISDAQINLEWEDKFYHNDWNFTKTDSSGYFRINVAKGEGDLWIHSEDYYYNLYNFGWSSFLEDEDIYFEEINLLSRPQESSIITGTITDKETNEPLENVIVVKYCLSHPYIFDIDWTTTDSSGNYHFDIPPGYIDIIFCDIDGYISPMNLPDYLDLFRAGRIESGETRKFDFEMSPIHETSILRGYVKDQITSDPVADAEVWLHWNDKDDFIYLQDSNITYTDSTGYFEFNVGAGVYDITFIEATGYVDRHFSFPYVEGEMEDFETVTVDIEITPFPEENSVICGYITDKMTSEPIENSWVSVYCYGDNTYYYVERTKADSSGFYFINIAAGEVSVYASSGKYISGGSQDYNINEYETIFANFSLEKKPPENSIVYGNILDNVTNEPIKYAMVFVHGYNNGYHYHNQTIADQSGSYNIHVCEGQISIELSFIGYDTREIEFTVSEFENYQVDASLDDFYIQLTKPQKWIYRNNNRIFPFFVPLIIGPIEVEATGSPSARTVLFFIDEELKGEDYYFFQPFNWTWNEKSFGKHKLTILSYGDAHVTSNYDVKDIFVWKFF